MLSGDRLSFFIAPFESNIPTNSGGEYLVLFSIKFTLNNTQNQIVMLPFNPKKKKNQIVAVKFDTYKNLDFLDQSDNQVGIVVN